MNTAKWNELREHAKLQKQKYSEMGSSIGNLGTHIWQDILNKMWSIENKK